MKTDNKKTFTPEQQQVIDSRNINLLVSASAGTGKTTVMIERVVSLVENGADVDDFVVVTFTNLAATEMKTRLAARMASYEDHRMAIQREKLDTASICTLHSFCGNLLRTYFYAVDLDPSFVILDSATTDSLKKAALDELFAEYFEAEDNDFYNLYRIYATNRREDVFRKLITDLYDFSRNVPNFADWYEQKRNNVLTIGASGNPLTEIIREDIQKNLRYYADSVCAIVDRAEKNSVPFVDILRANAQAFSTADASTAENALYSVAKLPEKLLPLPRANSKKDTVETTEAHASNKLVTDSFKQFAEKYQKLLHGQNYQTLLQESKKTVANTDKLVEILLRFEQKFYAGKKDRGGIDFGDLEHLTLSLLGDEQILAEIKAKHKYIFVDEYQDTNPVQEAIVSKLEQGNNLFMVGDVKQSIYGFRGCEPDIFVQKYGNYKQGKCGKAIELNDNFRSNKEILEFVNDVFDFTMTPKFGKVDYKHNAQLKHGNSPSLPAPSVSVDFVKPLKKQSEQLTEIYDITKPQENVDAISQGKVIADIIRRRVGQPCKIGDTVRNITYDDVVILMRSLTDKAIDIYNTLLGEHIPVAATFKTDSAACKEIRDVINFLRVVDNPLCDIPLVGTCLSCFGGFTESELAAVRLDTPGRTSFYERLVNYESRYDNQIAAKIKSLLQKIQKVRFFSYGANVNDTVLYLLQLTDYTLYVQGLPSGSLRLAKLYQFIGKLKGASYGQSIDKLLTYLDDRTDNRDEERFPSADAVKMMTMHASKGLEFPVVIIAGADSKFNFDNNAVERNSALGIAEKYYDDNSMTVAPSLSFTACNLYNKNKQREEEMRLLYVAMTRAKCALHIVGSVNDKQLKGITKMPSNAGNHLDWIVAALYEKFGDDLWNVHTDKLHTKVVDENTPLEQTQTLEGKLCKQSDDAKTVAKMMQYAYPYALETEMPVKLVSSALDKEYIEKNADDTQTEKRENPKEHIINVNNNRAYIGTAYHKVLEEADLHADYDQIDRVIDTLVQNAVIDPQIAQKLDKSLIYAALNDQKLTRLADGGQIYKEIPFMTYAPYNQIAADKWFSDNVMLQGVIDLLIRLPNKAIVVDYKYTTKNEQQIVDSYKMQLNSYRLAVQSIGIENVDCYVYSIENGKLIKID